MFVKFQAKMSYIDKKHPLGLKGFSTETNRTKGRLFGKSFRRSCMLSKNSNRNFFDLKEQFSHQEINESIAEKRFAHVFVP